MLDLIVRSKVFTCMMINAVANKALMCTRVSGGERVSSDVTGRERHGNVSPRVPDALLN